MRKGALEFSVERIILVLLLLLLVFQWRCGDKDALQRNDLSRQRLQTLEKLYGEKVKQYRHKTDSLTALVKPQQKAIAESKERTVVIRKKIREVVVVADTQCAMVLEMAESELLVKDSLLDQQHELFSELVSVKDTMLRNDSLMIKELTGQLKEELDENKRLIKEGERQAKKERRKGLLKGILATLAIVGIVATVQ